MWAPKRHGTIRQCMDNLSTWAEPRSGGQLQVNSGVGVSGHGAPGELELGGGHFGLGKERVITLGNIDTWYPILQEYSKEARGSGWLVYSCDTGAGEDGAKLLWRMASALKRPVLARTGKTIWTTPCLSISFEPNSTWQGGRPGSSAPEAAIPGPPAPSRLNSAESIMRNLVVPNQSSLMDFGTITEVRVTWTHQSELRTDTLSGNAAKALLDKLFYASTGAPVGQLPALITSRLSLVFSDRGPLEATVFANSIARIEGTGTWLRVDPSLKNHISDLAGLTTS